MAAAVAIGFAGATAHADSCSGRSHPAGTIIGAIGGGLIGSQFGGGSGKIATTAGGAVLGGMAGNQIARSADCRRRYHHSAYYYRHHRTYTHTSYDRDYDRDYSR